jgi:hypothetical protein
VSYVSKTYTVSLSKASFISRLKSNKLKLFVRFEILVAVTLRNIMIWYVKPCSLAVIIKPALHYIIASFLSALLLIMWVERWIGKS